MYLTKQSLSHELIQYQYLFYDWQCYRYQLITKKYLLQATSHYLHQCWQRHKTVCHNELKIFFCQLSYILHIHQWLIRYFDFASCQGWELLRFANVRQVKKTLTAGISIVDLSFTLVASAWFLCGSCGRSGSRKENHQKMAEKQNRSLGLVSLREFSAENLL